MAKKMISIILSIMMILMFLSIGGYTAEKTIVNFWNMRPSPESPGAKPELEVIEMFEKKNPNIDVRVQYIPFEQYDTKLVTAAEAGNPPDCSYINWVNLFSYISPGYLEPLDKYIEKSDIVSRDAYYKGGLVGLYKDKLYALPQGTGTYLIYYNKNLFETAGVEVPRSWDELAKACEKLYDPPQHWGMALAMGNHWYVFDEFFSYLIAANGKITNENATAVYTYTPEFKKTWYFYTNLVLEHNAAPPGHLSADGQQAHTMFAQQKVAMLKSGPWGKGNIEAQNPDLDWGLFKLPGPEKGQYGSVVGGWQFGIWKDAENKNAAWKFLEFLQIPEMQARWSSEHNLPWLKKARDYPPFSENPFLQEFLGIMPYAQFHMPPVPEIPKVSRAIHKELQAVCLEAKTQDEALADLTVKLDEILPDER